MLVVNPKGVYFSFDNTFLFDEYDEWRNVLVLPKRSAGPSWPIPRSGPCWPPISPIRGGLARHEMG